MTVRRVMGTEVEYGISVPGHPNANSMLLSSQVVTAYAWAHERATRARWDYEEEHPLRDARGFEVDGGWLDPAGQGDEESGLANVILTNGARLYVDHAHPEFSTPEVTNPLDAVLWDKAGELVMAQASQLAAQVPGAMATNLYKNNTDNKGASYGTHENYLVDRATPFNALVRHMTPFFVTRQVVAGSGRVGIGQDGREHGFQLSQRADFFEAEVGLETTLKRPIINTRDEPHADPALHRRFHVIVGDANLSEISTYLKVGTTSLVLSMVEAGWLDDSLTVAHPVMEIRAVSHDYQLGHRVELVDGRRLTGVQIQLEYLDAARKFVQDRYGADADEQTVDILNRWEFVLNALETDPMSLADQLDWIAKLKLLEGYRRRDNLEWSDPTLQLVDLQYSDVRPAKGLYHRLVSLGRMQTLLDPEVVTRATTHAPEDTRAWFRGECLRRYGPDVSAASWDSVVFEIPGHDALQRIPTLDPLRGTRERTEALLVACATAADLVAAVTAEN